MGELGNEIVHTDRRQGVSMRPAPTGGGFFKGYNSSSGLFLVQQLCFKYVHGPCNTHTLIIDHLLSECGW